MEDGEAIVIDTPIDSVSTEELINFIHTQLDATIKIVIPTHYHIDCIGGLDVFLADEIPTAASLRPISQLPTELDKVKFTFYSDMLISVGKHEISIFYPGPGHTQDNIVAYYPEDQMLFGGCLVKAKGATKGNLKDANTAEWSYSIERIEMKFPEIENEYWILDIGAAKLADTPEDFEVIVMPNLYGDVISDISAQITGSVGLAGSSNIGEECAKFEAIHGSAPDIAGKNIANPSALLNRSVMMLNHIGQSAIAEKIHDAWLYTIEQGVHTADIYDESHSKHKVGTKEFAEHVIANLGQKPSTFEAINYGNRAALKLPKYQK